jgi:hypothetical protein
MAAFYSEYGRKYGMHTFEAKVTQRIERQRLKSERRRRRSAVRAKGKSRASGGGESDPEAFESDTEGPIRPLW